MGDVTPIRRRLEADALTRALQENTDEAMAVVRPQINRLIADLESGEPLSPWARGRLLEVMKALLPPEAQ